MKMKVLLVFCVLGAGALYFGSCTDHKRGNCGYIIATGSRLQRQYEYARSASGGNFG